MKQGDRRWQEGPDILLVGKGKTMAKKIKSRVPPSQKKRKELRQGLTFFCEKKMATSALREIRHSKVKRVLQTPL